MKPTKVKIKVTIEREGEEDNVFEMEYDDAVICQERGHIVTYATHECGPCQITPNKHERVLIKAWKGCKSYDFFVAREERTVSPSIAEIESKSGTVGVNMKKTFDRLTTMRPEMSYPDGLSTEDIDEMIQGDGLLTMGGITAPREVWRDVWELYEERARDNPKNDV